MFNQQMYKIFVTHVHLYNYIQLSVTLGYERLLDDNTLVSKHVGVIGNK